MGSDIDDALVDDAPAKREELAVADVQFGPLPELVGFMVRQAQLRMFEAFYADLADDGIRPGLASILVTIGENPGIRQGVLADALRIKWSNMAKIVRYLDDDALVERRVAKSDRRAFELHLTDRGRKLVARALPKIRASDRRATAILDPDELTTLRTLLAKLSGI